MLGHLVKDEVLGGKPAKCLVFPAKAHGRRNPKGVLGTLPPGGCALCRHLSLSAGRMRNTMGFTAMTRLCGKDNGVLQIK